LHRVPHLLEKLALIGLLALAGAGCSRGAGSCDAPSGSPAPSTLPRLDQTWSIATHNSYWVNRAVPGDLSASGVEERLVDQILADHARGLELDIHKDPDAFGSFAVFHTQAGNSLCDTLAQCLGLLRAIDYAVPQHEAITIVLELKELTTSNFDLDHTVDDLDSVLTAELGDRLYRPADLLARCSAKNFCTDDVSACVKAVGWPAVDELRGKFIVGVMGSWDNIGAISTADWATYALHGPISDRAAFPMASSWKHVLSALPSYEQALVTQAQLDEAFARSGILQVEDPGDPGLAPWIAGHGFVRIDGAALPADQQTRAQLGAQLLQTDSPWSQFDDLGPAIPLRSYRAGDAPTLLREPGNRSLLLPSTLGARVFAWTMQPANQADTELESTIASGSSSEAVGCLRAAAGLGQGNEISLTVCRAKVSALRTSNEPGDPNSETVIASITQCANGSCSTVDHPSAGGHDASGDLLQLEVKARGSGSCATASVASSIDRSRKPVWLALAPAFCTNAPLVYQGLSRFSSANEASTAPAYFTGTRRDGIDVISSDFTVTSEPAYAAPSPTPGLLVTP
jgi:hypothetical protein